MNDNKKKGNYGEKVAAHFIVKKGFEVLEMNFRTVYGEIDIIAKKDSCIAFIEVKFRSSIKNGYPSEAVGIKKQRKIIKTSLEYISINNIENMDFRFDVIELMKIGETIYINHIENAFWLEEGLI